MKKTMLFIFLIFHNYANAITPISSDITRTTPIKSGPSQWTEWTEWRYSHATPVTGFNFFGKMFTCHYIRYSWILPSKAAVKTETKKYGIYRGQQCPETLPS